jgi:hypothetical protein
VYDAYPYVAAISSSSAFWNAGGAVCSSAGMHAHNSGWIVYAMEAIA